MSFLVKITHTVELTIEHYFVSICLSLRDRLNTDAQVEIHAQCPESVTAAKEILKLLQDEFPQNETSVNQDEDKLIDITFTVKSFENTRPSITILSKYLDNLVIFQRKAKKQRNKENKQKGKQQKQAKQAVLQQNDPDFENQGLNGFNLLRSLSDDLTEIQVTNKENPKNDQKLPQVQNQPQNNQRQSLKEFQQSAQKKQMEKQNQNGKKNENKKNQKGITKHYDPSEISPYVPKTDLQKKRYQNQGTRAKQGEIVYPRDVEIRDGVKMYRGGKQQSNNTRDQRSDSSDSEYREALKNIRTRGQQR